MNVKCYAKYSLFIAVILSAVGECRNYETLQIRTGVWPTGTDASLRDVGIGYFEYSGTTMSANRSDNRKIFYGSLAYALRESGFRTMEASDFLALLTKHEIPADRTLAAEDIMRLNDRFAGKLIIQGAIYEQQTDTLTEDVLQIIIIASVHDMSTGKKIGDIRTYASDLEYNSGRTALDLAREIARSLDSLVVDRKGK